MSTKKRRGRKRKTKLQKFWTKHKKTIMSIGSILLILLFLLFPGVPEKIEEITGIDLNLEQWLDDVLNGSGGSNVSVQMGSEFDISKVPEYSGEPYVAINDNIPFFTDDEMTDKSFEYYSELDYLGRCGTCVASIGKDIMPTEDRESISSVTPSGWENNKYSTELVDGGYIYNRCHLIGFQLTGENANNQNLITGTRYLNIDGMVGFENMIADYVKETGNHVMLRVTPIFEGNNLLASGVLMEAKSVEDGGDGILFNVFCYNVQPGIVLDYATGNNWKE